MKISGFLILAVVTCSVHGKNTHKSKKNAVTTPSTYARKHLKKGASVTGGPLNLSSTKRPEGIATTVNQTIKTGRAFGEKLLQTKSGHRISMLGRVHYPAPREHCRSKFGDPPKCKPTMRKIRDFYTKKPVDVTIYNYPMCLKQGDYGFGQIKWTCGSQSVESKLFSSSWNHGLPASKRKGQGKHPHFSDSSWKYDK